MQDDLISSVAGGGPEQTLLRQRTSPQPLIAPGTRLLNGKFEVGERLGSGGMGVVYEALDLDAARLQDPHAKIAIKVLSEAIHSLPEAALALQRESSRARRLSHPNIVRIHEFYQDGNASFITMEHLRGCSWDRLFRELPVGMRFDAALPLITQLCEGLEYAHSQGVVHSDLKPANIFLTEDNTVKILDFGIATRVRKADSQSHDTLYNPRQLGALSASHACLELWLGLDAEPRDDVYSLGCVVYELLSGRHPFGRATAVEVFDRGISPDPIESLTGTQNAALLQALKLQRKERTASVRDFRMQVAAAGGPLATWNAIRAARSARQTLVAASAIIAAVVGGYFLRAPRHPPMPGGSMAIPQPLSPLQSVSPPAGLPAQGSTMQPGAAAQMTPLHPGRGLPNPSDYYPVASRRLGEQGTATVKVCVDPHGHLAAPPSIVESSGSSRLDDAALQYATDSSGHWRPATRNGIPITACSNMPIRFQMTDRF